MSKPVPEQSLVNGQVLCAACGMCCDGTWFSHVDLNHEEADMARKIGLEFKQTDKGLMPKQPCAMYKNGRCSVYDTWRPRACADYRCALLENYTAGKLSYDEAVQTVNEIRQLADKVRSAMPTFAGVASREFNEQLAAGKLKNSCGQVPSSPDAEFDAVTLVLYYKKYFKVQSGN